MKTTDAKTKKLQLNTETIRTLTVQTGVKTGANPLPPGKSVVYTACGCVHAK